ncbi:MAG TPA: VanZ family protein [Methylomirabilota bacterium]|jgi:VanZ family protein
MLLLSIYLLFLLYGSFFPFHFATDLATVRHNLDAAVLFPYDAGGQRTFSLPDVASNVLVGLPLGLLLVTRRPSGSSPAAEVFRCGLLALLLASAIEAGQLFTSDRTASVIDIAGQVVGSVTGGLVGLTAVEAMQGSATQRLLPVFRERRAAAPLAALALVLAADSLYPYAVTLDVSTLWGNFKQTAWTPLAGDLPWHALLVERILPYAVLGALAVAVLSPRSPSTARPAAWALCVAYAAGLETGKLFIEGRAPTIAHLPAAALGTLIGVLASPVKLVPPATLVLGAAGFLAYQELTPFDFLWSVDHVHARMPEIEWLPFASYYWADPQSALFDVGKKLLLGAGLGAALGTAGSRAPAAWALGLGVLLEAMQLLERSHRPAVTDVLLFVAGAIAGASLLARYHTVLDSR